MICRQFRVVKTLNGSRDFKNEVVRVVLLQVTTALSYKTKIILIIVFNV